MNRIPTHTPFWSTTPARLFALIVVAVVAGALCGCTDRTPTADDFTLAEKYCSERWLKPVGLIRPLDGVTAGIGCEQKDSRGWYEIPSEVFNRTK